MESGAANPGTLVTDRFECRYQPFIYVPEDMQEKRATEDRRANVFYSIDAKCLLKVSFFGREQLADWSVEFS